MSVSMLVQVATTACLPAMLPGVDPALMLRQTLAECLRIATAIIAATGLVTLLGLQRRSLPSVRVEGD